MVAIVGAVTITGFLYMMWHNFRLPGCCFAQRQVCFVLNLIVLRYMWYNIKAALCQLSVEKTDVNQIYGEYYFSSDGERRDSVTEVDNIRN